MQLISLLITSCLTENIILSKFLGICPFMGTSDKEKSALGMGLSVTVVVMLSSIITYFLYHFVLVPTDSTYLMTVMFIMVIACMVQIISFWLKRYIPTLHKSLGLYLPLITTNCAVLGITLLNIQAEYSFIEMIVYSLGSSLGFTLVIYLFALVREQLEDVPKCFEGYPIAFIIAGIMAILFGRIL